ncbi:O-antigen ligase family protein [Anaerofustis stercorihominis]|uniref:O-antigen ligase-related domain-containing protein n=1 Tax=Anaerofustis stercorihominis TaxID=214853 RepID=A0A3E3E2D6_9FIRM|nr:O-antigen ligase family protein [Anaerofustis stercorihominis]RGD75329.1 hypothetical protein DW687_03110 [Anaerofustis stercorihominis]
MEIKSKKSNLIFNVILIITMLIFVIRNTLLLKLDNTFFIGLNLISFFLCIIVFIYNYIKTIEKFDVKKFIKNNIIIILYFVVRLITLYIKGFDNATLRSIVIEFFLLVILFRGLTLNGNDPKKILKPCIIIISLVTAFFILRVVYYLFTSSGLEESFLKSLIYSISGTTFNVNPNDGGILVTFVIAFSLFYIEKKDYKYYICFIISIAYLFLSGCRSAITGLIVIAFCYLITKFCKKIGFKKQMAAVLSLSLAYLIIMFTVVGINSKVVGFTPFENMWNTYSSQRYMLDKYTILSLKDDFLLGFGSYEYTGQKRYDYLMDNIPQMVDVKLGADAGYVSKYRTLNAHNGFLDFIAGNGLICLILFLYFFINRIKNIDDKVCKKYFLPIIYMIVVSNFENTILNIIPFMFFLIILFIASMEYEQLKINESNENI